MRPQEVVARALKEWWFEPTSDDVSTDTSIEAAAARVVYALEMQGLAIWQEYD